MTELEKYNLINQSETPQQLKQSLEQIAEDGFIKGRREDFTLEEQLDAIDKIIKGWRYNLLTRSYGIRQQMIYIMHYARN